MTMTQPRLQGKLRQFAEKVIELNFDILAAHKAVYTHSTPSAALHLVSTNEALKQWLSLQAQRLSETAEALATARLTSTIRNEKTSARDAISAAAELRKAREFASKQQHETDSDTEYNIRVIIGDNEEE